MKQVGFLIKEPDRDPLYPRVELVRQGMTDADRAAGYTSEPVFTFQPLPDFYRPSPRVRIALEQWRSIKRDLDTFDGDKRGIVHALGEAEFAIFAAIAADHAEDDEGDHNAFVTSPLVALLDHLVRS